MTDLCPGCLQRLAGIVAAIGEPGYFNRPADRADQLADLSFARRFLDAATDIAAAPWAARSAARRSRVTARSRRPAA